MGSKKKNRNKDPRLSTSWFVANYNDAQQIAEEFHGEGEPGHWNFEENRAKIANAIVGQPKKQVLALVGWALEKRLEANEQIKNNESVEPFVCAQAFDEWAQRRGIGRYSNEIVV